MATIGTFKKTGSNEFTGDIVTLSVQAKGVRIIPDLRATRDRIAEGHYHLLTCVNESDRLVSGPFEEMIVFTDTVSHLNAKYIIPIDAPCEKAGTVIDQFGAYKSVRGPLRRRGYPLELFFS